MKLFARWFDERFVMHRLKSTRFAAVVTAVAMAVYAEYEIFTARIVPWDAVAFLGIMLAAKLAAMVYYRTVN